MNYDQYQRDLKYGRTVSTEAIYRIMLLSASTVGLSVTFFSIPAFQGIVEIEKLKPSWVLLVVVIALGGLILLGEGRLKYLLTWQSDNTLASIDIEKISYKNQLKGWLIAILGLVHPVWFTRVRFFATNKDERDIKAMIMFALASCQHDIIFLEVVVYGLFVIALGCLVTSVM
jgi:hypothetical protein